nr:zinc finger, CCHC-type [Tanacetum cinerariifolium]
MYMSVHNSIYTISNDGLGVGSEESTGFLSLLLQPVSTPLRVGFLPPHLYNKEGAQGNRKAKVFQVSNDDTAVAQRRLEDKQPEEKTNTDCLVKEQEKEYYTGWKIKTGNVLDSCNQMSTQQCMKSWVAKHLGVVGIQQQNGLVNETTVTLFAKRLDDVTSKVALYKNMGFNKSGEYKKTFIGYGVGTSSVQVLQGVEFEVEPQEDHTFEVEPHGNVDHVAGSHEVQTQDLIYYHLARDGEQHSTHELFSYREDTNEAAFVVAKAKKINAHKSLTFNNTVAYDAEIWATKGLLDKAKGNVLGMEIVKDQSDNTLRVSRSRFYNEKLEYQMVYTRLDITSKDVGMLDKFSQDYRHTYRFLWILTTSWEDRSLSWVDQSQGTG